MSAPARFQATPARATEGRSSEHHVVVGLGFLSSLKKGDIDACTEMLHPDVGWHPSPKLVVENALHGRFQVRHQLEAMYERFDDLDIVPEEGRQIGDHVLLVALLKGRNRLTGQDAQARVCWVITVRDDLWWRIVVYPNPPSARLGFEELLVGVGEAPRVLADADRRAAAGPRGEQSAVGDVPNGDDAAAAVDAPTKPSSATPDGLALTFTLEEAAALSEWLARQLEDGARIGDDAEAWPAFVKLRAAVERAQALAEVRAELASAGLDAEHLGDDEVATLARTIATAAERFSSLV